MAAAPACRHLRPPVCSRAAGLSTTTMPDLLPQLALCSCHTAHRLAYSRHAPQPHASQTGYPIHEGWGSPGNRFQVCQGDPFPLCPGP